MRLIDADKLHSKIFQIGCQKCKMHPMDVMKIIEEQPTAYNVENVVAELEELKTKYKKLCEVCEDKFEIHELECKCIQISKDIEIVKRGGTP